MYIIPLLNNETIETTISFLIKPFHFRETPAINSIQSLPQTTVYQHMPQTKSSTKLDPEGQNTESFFQKKSCTNFDAEFLIAEETDDSIAMINLRDDCNESYLSLYESN